MTHFETLLPNNKRDQIRHPVLEVSGQVYDQVKYQVCGQVRVQVGHQVEDQVRNQVWRQIREDLQ